MAIAKVYAEKHRVTNYSAFIKGSIAPDFKSQRIRHYFNHGVDTKDIRKTVTDRINLSKSLLEIDTNMDFGRGVFLHLLADNLCYINVLDIDKFQKAVNKDGADYYASLHNSAMKHFAHIATKYKLGVEDFKATWLESEIEQDDIAWAKEMKVKQLVGVDDIMDIAKLEKFIDEITDKPIDDVVSELRFSMLKDMTRHEYEEIPVPERKYEPQPEPQSEYRPAPEPEPVYEPEPVIIPEPEPEPEQIIIPEPEPIIIPEPEPEPEPEPIIVPEPEPEPELIIIPEPEPVIIPEPEPSKIIIDETFEHHEMPVMQEKDGSEDIQSFKTSVMANASMSSKEPGQGKEAVETVSEEEVSELLPSFVQDFFKSAPTKPVPQAYDASSVKDKLAEAKKAKKDRAAQEKEAKRIEKTKQKEKKAKEKEKEKKKKEPDEGQRVAEEMMKSFQNTSMFRKPGG